MVCHLLLEILREMVGHSRDESGGWWGVGTRVQALSGGWLAGVCTLWTPGLLPEAPGGLRAGGEALPPCRRLGHNAPLHPPTPPITSQPDSRPPHLALDVKGQRDQQ